AAPKAELRQAAGKTAYLLDGLCPCNGLPDSEIFFPEGSVMRARDSVLQHEPGKGFRRPLVCLHHGDLLG
ncbi:MAG: hypothetical protein EBW14_08685, partial [Oxalobacteraceae bacterium]|nr:hypothetical protein [Oxalobacteraceae bacterium]